MARERWITVETAKEVLKNTCDFLEKDEVADFRIVNGKEAVLLSIYSPAFFLLNEEYKFKFRPVLDGDCTRESLNVIPLKSEIMSINDVPIFGLPLSWYFSFFPNLNEPKYLFLIDKRNYAKRKSRELYIVRNLLEKIKESINPTDCLVWISDEDGTFGEGFWEYVSGIVLRNKGYFVTKYASAPRGYGRLLIYGFGDLSAYYIPKYIGRLMERGFLNEGAFIEELEMLRKCFDQNVNRQNQTANQSWWKLNRVIVL